VRQSLSKLLKKFCIWPSLCGRPSELGSHAAKGRKQLSLRECSHIGQPKGTGLIADVEERALRIKVLVERVVDQAEQLDVRRQLIGRVQVQNSMKPSSNSAATWAAEARTDGWRRRSSNSPSRQVSDASSSITPA